MSIDTIHADLERTLETKISRLKNEQLMPSAKGVLVGEIRQIAHDIFVAALADLNPDVESNGGRGDVHFGDIAMMFEEVTHRQVPSAAKTNKTPDMVKFEHDQKRFYVLDVKTSASRDIMGETIDKYRTAFREFTSFSGYDLLVGIIAFNPYDGTIMTLGRVPKMNLRISEDDHESVLKIISYVDRMDQENIDDQEYVDARYQGSISIEGQLTNHIADYWGQKIRASKQWEQFVMDNGEVIGNLVIGMGSGSHHNSIMIADAFASYVNGIADLYMSELDEQTSEIKAAHDFIIKSAFADLESNYMELYEVRRLNEATPSIHYLSAPHMDTGTSNYNRIQYLSNVAKKTRSMNPIVQLMASLDLTDEKIRELELKKQYKDPGKVILLPNQDIVFPKGSVIKSRIFNSAKVGKGYIKNQNRNILEIDHSPRMKYIFGLSGEDEDMLMADFHESFKILSEQTRNKNNAIQEFLKTFNPIEENSELTQFLGKCSTSKAAASLNDMETNLQNMLSVSEGKSGRHVTIITGKSGSGLYFVLPTVTSTNSDYTLVYQSMHLIKNSSKMHRSDLVEEYIKVDDAYTLVVTKPVRINKSRINHLVSAHLVFYTMCAKWFLLAQKQMGQGEDVNGKIISDIIGMSFYASQQITLGYTSVVDTLKNMILGSIAEASDISGFITTKYEPKIKNAFSFFVYLCIKRGLPKLNREFSYASNSQVELNLDGIRHGGLKNLMISSMFIRGLKLSTVKDIMEEGTMLHFATSKDLHDDIHGLIKLYRVPLELELESRAEAPMTQDDRITLFACLAEYNKYRSAAQRSMRQKLFGGHGLTDTWVNLSTLISTKSCVSIVHSRDANQRKDEDGERKIKFPATPSKKALEELRTNNWILTKPSKVFEEAIKLSSGRLPRWEHAQALSNMVELTDHMPDIDPKVTIFAKQQRTSSDREIYQGTYEMKILLVFIELIARNHCLAEPREMIKEAGDRKMISYNQMIANSYRLRRQVEDEPGSPNKLMFSMLSADASKWSAKDLYDKFIYYIASNKALRSEERMKMIWMLLQYREKKLVLLDKVIYHTQDIGDLTSSIFREMTNNFDVNYVTLTQNWLQGNLNYLSSLCHAAMHHALEAGIQRANVKQGEMPLAMPSVVHSDDSFLCINMFAPKDVTTIQFAKAVFRIVQYVAGTFSITLNAKKCFMHQEIGEFLSKYTVRGLNAASAMSVLLPALKEVPHTNASLDIAAMMGPIQQGIINNAEPSLIALIKGLCLYKVQQLYSLLPGQVNSIDEIFLNKAWELPAGVLGSIARDDVTAVALGTNSGDYERLSEILNSLVPHLTSIEAQVNSLKYIDIKLSDKDTEFLKLVKLLTKRFPTNEMKTGFQGLPTASLYVSVLQPMMPKGIIRKDLSIVQHYIFMLKNGLLQEKLKDISDRHPEWFIMSPENPADLGDYFLMKLSESSFAASLSTTSIGRSLINKIKDRRAKVIPADFMDRTRVYIDDPSSSVGEEVSKISLHDALVQIKNDADATILLKDELIEILRLALLEDKNVRDHFFMKKHLRPEIQGSRSRQTDTILVPSKLHTRKSQTINPPRIIILYTLFPGMRQHLKVPFRESLDLDVETLSNLLSSIGLMAQLLNAEGEEHLRLLKIAMRISMTFLASAKVDTRAFHLFNQARSILDFHSSLSGARISDKSVYKMAPTIQNMNTMLIGGQDDKDSSIQEAFRQGCAFLRHLSKFLDSTTTEEVYRAILENIRINGESFIRVLKQSMNNRILRFYATSILFRGGWVTDYAELLDSHDHSRVRSHWIHSQRVKGVGKFRVIYSRYHTELIVAGNGAQLELFSLMHASMSHWQHNLDPIFKKVILDFPNLGSFSQRLPGRRLDYFRYRVEMGRHKRIVADPEGTLIMTVESTRERRAHDSSDYMRRTSECRFGEVVNPFTLGKEHVPTRGAVLGTTITNERRLMIGRLCLSNLIMSPYIQGVVSGNLSALSIAQVAKFCSDPTEQDLKIGLPSFFFDDEMLEQITMSNRGISIIESIWEYKYNWGAAFSRELQELHENMEDITVNILFGLNRWMVINYGYPDLDEIIRLWGVSAAPEPPDNAFGIHVMNDVTRAFIDATRSSWVPVGQLEIYLKEMLEEYYIKQTLPGPGLMMKYFGKTLSRRSKM